MNESLAVQNLKKSYPGFNLQNVSFSVLPGRIMGLIMRHRPVHRYAASELVRLSPRDIKTAGAIS